MTSRLVQDSSENLILTLFALIVFYWLSYLFIASSLIRVNYRKSEQGIDILIDNAQKHLTYINNKKVEKDVITNESVKAIELYYSWNTHPFTSDLGYSKIILKDDTNIFITQDKLSQYEIKSIFKNKVTKEKTQFMNRLK
ncbi:hypothetical protein [Aquimarina sp. SS2-1]|uniref:hypothetical protein n=1 Tax=Aquimarina besae TaxID=3342247 RepID=UPI00366F868B